MILQNLFNRLFDYYGPQHWWPASSPFEVIIGAILTQNTNWRNVEKAIANLKHIGALNLESFQTLSIHDLEQLIRPSGFFRQKALRLQNFCNFLDTEFQGDLQKLFAQPLPQLRDILLKQNGIGPETADSIILYAANRPSFVIDSYTQRILERVGITTDGYESTRALFMNELPHDTGLFNEYHALLVRLAKEQCHKRRPDCPGCPLRSECSSGQSCCQN